MPSHQEETLQIDVNDPIPHFHRQLVGRQIAGHRLDADVVAQHVNAAPILDNLSHGLSADLVAGYVGLKKANLALFLGQGRASLRVYVQCRDLRPLASERPRNPPPNALGTAGYNNYLARKISHDNLLYD